MFRWSFSRSICFIYVVLKGIYLCTNVSAQSSYERRIIRRADVDTLERYFGTKEEIQNGGRVISRIIKSVGGRVGQPYCSYGKLYCAKVNKIKLLKSINGTAASWLIKNAVKVRFGKVIDNTPVKRGDIVLIRRNGGSGYHVETLRRWNTEKPNYCLTGGFNTRSPYEHQSRAEGVFPHWRAKKLIIILDVEKAWNMNESEIHALCVQLNRIYLKQANK